MERYISCLHFHSRKGSRRFIGEIRIETTGLSSVRHSNYEEANTMQQRCARLRSNARWALILFSVFLAGCGGGGSGTSSGGGGGSAISGPDPTTLSISGATPEGLAVSLAQDHSTIAVNGTVVYTETISNPTTQPVSFQSSDQAGTTEPLVPASLTVVNSSGASVYSNPAPAQAVMVTLQPGDYFTETLTLSNTFQAQGRYSATATFETGATPTALGLLVLTAR
jgi:hypothetical protein